MNSQFNDFLAIILSDNKAICKKREIEVASPTSERGLAKDKLKTSCISVKQIIDNDDDEAHPPPFHDEQEEEEKEEDTEDTDEEKMTMITMMMMIIMVMMMMMMTMMIMNQREYLIGVWRDMSTSSR